ncbi:MAG: hypothetical protein EAZ07_07180 [Cytophagales bacterium]|nr:MAG: hypothetical protein EAZ07_07180 [Cytophagales bacterium]
MKKSSLKYIFLFLLVGIIFYLYQLNKQTYLPKSVSSNNSSTSSINSFGSQDLSFSDRGEFSDGSSSTVDESTSQSNSSQFSNNMGGGSMTMFDKNDYNSSSDAENTSLPKDYQAVTYSNNNVNSSNGGGGGIGIGLPIGGLQTFSLEDSENDKKSKRSANNSLVASNQTAKKGNFFSGGGGQLETPMAPGTPDDEIPLDGGVSLLIALGSLFGFRKLFVSKKK